MSKTIVFLLYSRKFLINFTKTSTMADKYQRVNHGQIDFFLQKQYQPAGHVNLFFSSHFRRFSCCTEAVRND